MSNNLSFQAKQSQNLQLSLKLWLPLLQAPLQDLDTIFKEHSYDNPFLESKSSFESNYSNRSAPSGTNYDKSNFIENTSTYKESFYDKVSNQITAPLFPTPNSQRVANEILLYIDSEGYFEGDIESIAIKCNTTNEFVENVRQRFSYLEPYGVGAKDLQESFLFQLSNIEVNDELNKFTTKLISNLKQIDKYYKHHLFEEAKNIIHKFNSPPTVEYMHEEPYIVPDFFVEVGDDITLKINNSYYPDITVKDAFKTTSTELKEKLKEAKNLVNLLELRKSTLYKLVLLIVERQIGFFVGSELKPLTMAQIAEDIGFEESTISRAVSNKYIQCERGVFSLKSFFTNAVSKDLSSSEVKNYLSTLIENESHEAPLTDQDLVESIMKRYSISMVRRTITKYRKLLNIPSSKERKKIYKIQVATY